MANSKEKITIKGKVIDSFPGARFKVALENGHEIDAHLCGKMRVKNNIRVMVGDSVDVEVCSYDPSKGRITYRINSMAS